MTRKKEKEKEAHRNTGFNANAPAGCKDHRRRVSRIKGGRKENNGTGEEKVNVGSVRARRQLHRLEKASNHTDTASKNYENKSADRDWLTVWHLLVKNWENRKALTSHRMTRGV